jgi:uncharacterized protein DUF2750
LTWNVNGKEFQNVIQLAPERRYEYFIKKVADWQDVWGLWDEGWAMMADDQGVQSIPVWPHRVYAEACGHEQWLGYLPKNITLHEWLEKWIPEMISDNQTVEVFPSPSGTAVVVEPKRLRADLEEELKKME